MVFFLLIFFLFFGFLFTVPALGGAFLQDYRATVPTGAPWINRITGAIHSLDNSINEGIFRRQDYVNLYGLMQRLMDKRVISDLNYGALYKTENGQIAFTVPRKDTTQELEQILQLKEKLDEAGIPLLYVQAPFKLREGTTELPPTVTNYANENADKFLAELAVHDIDYLDLRPAFFSSGMSQNQLFFNTDHHWTIDGAFLGFGVLAEGLNRDYGFSIGSEVRDIRNYLRQTYPQSYLGSMGRRVGASYCGVDDFTLITPDFPTDYTLYEQDRGRETLFNGSFAEAVLSPEYMGEGLPLETNRYAAYHGDNAELIFTNHLVDSGKALMIKDSFGLPIYSFLSLGVHELRALDVRLFQEDVAEYAKEYRPDVVIILYNADCFEKSLFDFGPKG